MNKKQLFLKRGTAQTERQTGWCVCGFFFVFRLSQSKINDRSSPVTMTDSPRIAPDFDDCENSTDDEQQLSGEPIVKPKPTETESEVKVDEAIRDIEVAPKKTKKRKAKGLAPKNNYSLFQEDVRKAGFPDDVKGFVASSRHIADLWNNAPDEIKDEYTKKALEYNKSLPKPEDQGDEEQQQEPKKKAKKSASKKEPNLDRAPRSPSRKPQPLQTLRRLQGVKARRRFRKS